MTDVVNDQGGVTKKTSNSDATSATPISDDAKDQTLVTEEKKQVVKKVDFKPKIETSHGNTERLIDHDLLRKRRNKEQSPAEKLQEFKSTWIKDKNFYLRDMKISEDDLVKLFVKELGVTSLGRIDLLYLFEKFRELRELQLRIDNLGFMKLFREFVSIGDIKMALDLLEFMQHDALGMEYIDEEDYKISGISAEDKDSILKNIDLDPENDEECERWVSYILFFSNPSTEWIRIRRRYEKTYFKILDTAMIQSLVNDDRDGVSQLLKWKPPTSLQSCPDGKKSPVVRADMSFSSYKRNTCPENCVGHRGKLLLLMIRLRNKWMVNTCLREGLPVTTQCCTGQIKSLYWDVDSGKNRPVRVKTEEEEEEEETYESFTKKDEPKKEEKKKKLTINLRAEYEYETPLSTAVVIGDVDIVKNLMTKGANPVRCDDVAIKSAVKTITKLSNSRIVDKKDVVVTKSDEEFILEKVCEEAQKKLFSAKKSKKGFAQPNYCTIALVYQAVLEENWEAVQILTKVRISARRAQTTVEPEYRFAKLLSMYNIEHSIPADALQTKSKLKAKTQTKNNVDKKGNMGKLAQFGKRALGKVTRADKFKETTGNISSAQSVDSYGTMVSNSKGDGGKEFIKDMNEDICYILVVVIDKLLAELERPNSATHSRALNGIVKVLERYNLYLDPARFDRLLVALTMVMKDGKAGDAAAVMRAFANKQFRHYLSFDVDPSWEYRSLDVFVKHDIIRKLLKINPGRKQQNIFGLGESKESVLGKVLAEAAKMDLPALIHDLRENGIYPDEEIVTEALSFAVAEENIASIRAIAKCYGKHLLGAAFTIALAGGAIEAIQEILQMDDEIDDHNFSLVESYIGQLLVVKENAGAPRQKNVEPAIVLKFFFVCADITDEKLTNILSTCFRRKESIDFAIVSQLLKTSLENKKSPPITRDLLDLYMASKSNQYDDKMDDIQTNWLKLLLDLYKLAVAKDASVEAAYNDKVVSLLELKPKFKDFIEVDSDDEEEEMEVQDTRKMNSGGWAEHSELL